MNIDNVLWASALQAVRNAGMDFTVPCAHNVKDLIRAGLAVMRREGRLAEQDVEAADASLMILVDEMIRTTRALGERPDARGVTRVRETALVRAKALCPLWPF